MTTTHIDIRPGERGFQPGCGCCVGPEDDRCICHFHQDVPRGRPVHKCSLHSQATRVWVGLKEWEERS